jgi:hypothetical protein
MEQFLNLSKELEEFDHALEPLRAAWIIRVLLRYGL